MSQLGGVKKLLIEITEEQMEGGGGYGIEGGGMG